MDKENIQRSHNTGLQTNLIEIKTGKSIEKTQIDITKKVRKSGTNNTRLFQLKSKNIYNKL